MATITQRAKESLMRQRSVNSLLAFVRKLSSYFHQSNEQQFPPSLPWKLSRKSFPFSSFSSHVDESLLRHEFWRDNNSSARWMEKSDLFTKPSSFILSWPRAGAVSRWFASNFLESGGKIYERARWEIESVHSERIDR